MEKTGIYFLKNGDEVVYVGQSNDMETRIETHRRKGKIGFDGYDFEELPIEELNEKEAFFITKFNPKYNSGIWPYRIRDRECMKKYSAFLSERTVRRLKEQLPGLNVSTGIRFAVEKYLQRER